MTTAHESETVKMQTTVKPNSLADVAQAMRAPGTRAIGTGLETRGIHAWFGKHHALSNISLDFAAGTVTALIGPSGCGKSTFIRTINRMHEFIPGAAMAGEVLLDGKDVYAPGTDVTKIRLQIGMVFQKPNPFPSMTIGENVLSGLKLAQLKVENKDELMQECLERAGLWSEVKDRLGAHGGSLSGGQQQRLCIARMNRKAEMRQQRRVGWHAARWYCRWGRVWCVRVMRWAVGSHGGRGVLRSRCNQRRSWTW